MVGEAGSGGDLDLSSDDALRAALPGALSRARVVITPYPFVAGAGDYLRVISLNSLTGATIEIHGRQAARGFEGTPFRFVHTPLTNRLPKTEDFPLNAGLVTNLSVYSSAGSPLIGQTFVIIQLVRSVGSVAFVLGTLLQGYVTSTQNLGWPGSAIQSSIEGGGYPRTIIGTRPAAGAETVETVPTGARWSLERVLVGLTTSAAAGNRNVRLTILSAGSATGSITSPLLQPPSTTVLYCYAPNLSYQQDSAGSRLSAPLMRPCILRAGDTFTTETIGLQAGDQWLFPQYALTEWLEAL